MAGESEASWGVRLPRGLYSASSPSSHWSAATVGPASTVASAGAPSSLAGSPSCSTWLYAPRLASESYIHATLVPSWPWALSTLLANLAISHDVSAGFASNPSPPFRAVRADTAASGAGASWTATGGARAGASDSAPVGVSACSRNAELVPISPTSGSSCRASCCASTSCSSSSRTSARSAANDFSDSGTSSALPSCSTCLYAPRFASESYIHATFVPSWPCALSTLFANLAISHEVSAGFASSPSPFSRGARAATAAAGARSAAGRGAPWPTSDSRSRMMASCASTWRSRASSRLADSCASVERPLVTAGAAP
mmetsp:Transcript_62292/g.148409  ORF Transcript_62292/g.148409 Transcript_62292/m.148409 type:complete len:314 (-) Transcript_62292:1505-2446(-)